jgi:hypothetical protein
MICYSPTITNACPILREMGFSLLEPQLFLPNAQHGSTNTVFHMYSLDEDVARWLLMQAGWGIKQRHDADPTTY